MGVKELETVTQALWAVLPGIVVGIALALWNRKEKRRDERNRSRELQRIESEKLRISLLVATAQLSFAVAMAVKRGAPNGEIEAGIEQYNKAMNQFRAFEREQLVKNSLD